jgi:Aromatic-ring-opening dioxygenase LigAB, LigA subunit
MCHTSGRRITCTGQTAGTPLSSMAASTLTISSTGMLTMRTRGTGTSATLRPWVSLYGVHKALFLVQNDLAFRERMRTDPMGALKELPLTDAERQALGTGDVATLYRMGTHTFLMSRLPRFNVPDGLTREEYQRRLSAVLS